jgi:hypothetical protein
MRLLLVGQITLFKSGSDMKYDPGTAKIAVHIIPVTAKGRYKLVSLKKNPLLNQ